MGLRTSLQSLLELQTEHVYFQPPANLAMSYPCIIYERDDADTKFAGNRPYGYIQRYKVTIVDADPDGEILAKVAALPMCVFNRHFVKGNLHHDVFVLYF